MKEHEFARNFSVRNPTSSAAALLSLICALLTVGCDLQRGGGRSLDAVPPGSTLLDQGPFTGSVGGTAQVYSWNGQVLLHLEGVSTTSTVRYFVFLESSTGGPSSPAYVAQMKATTGSQNYETGLSATGSAYSRVALREAAIWTSNEVASAALQAAPQIGVGRNLTVRLSF